MESANVWILIVIVLALAVVWLKITSGSERQKVFKDNTYQYTAKESLMSRTEQEFFIKLDRAVGERYFVFPQVHLSALLDHRIKGQEWRYAFRHINGKSVDYVLCDKLTLKPTYAIELDDFTHERNDRIKRDAEVERIFLSARLPLVRFADKYVTEVQIIQTLAEVRKTLA